MKLKDWFISNADSILTESYRIEYDIYRGHYDSNYNPNGTNSIMPLCTEGDLFKNGFNDFMGTTFATNLCVKRSSSYESHKLSNRNNNPSGNTDYQTATVSSSQYNTALINCYYGYDNPQSASTKTNYQYFYEQLGFLSANDSGGLKFCDDNELGPLPIYYVESFGDYANYSSDTYTYGAMFFCKINYISYNNYRTGNIDYTHYRLIFMPLKAHAYYNSSTRQYIICDVINKSDTRLESYDGDAIYQINVYLKCLCCYNILNPSQIFYPNTTLFSGGEYLKYQGSNGGGNLKYITIGGVLNINGYDTDNNHVYYEFIIAINVDSNITSGNYGRVYVIY